jgi:hypothetical protein
MSLLTFIDVASIQTTTSLTLGFIADLMYAFEAVMSIFSRFN